MNRLLTEKELAGLLAITVSALRRWRYEGRGPKFLKLGSAVRYPSEGVEGWLASRPGGGTR
jgi:predicted DNA-binding transcriptional regulator AlpA